MQAGTIRSHGAEDSQVEAGTQASCSHGRAPTRFGKRVTVVETGHRHSIPLGHTHTASQVEGICMPVSIWDPDR